MNSIRMVLGIVLLFISGCASKNKIMVLAPSPELEHVDGLLLFMAKQVINGESFVVSLNLYARIVGLTFTPVQTSADHRKLAELIHKKVMSRKEFEGDDGKLAFRIDTFYGFASCWMMDMHNISIVKFAEISDRKVSDILRAHDLWREIMLLGGRRLYNNSTG